MIFREFKLIRKKNNNCAPNKYYIVYYIADQTLRMISSGWTTDENMETVNVNYKLTGPYA